MICKLKCLWLIAVTAIIGLVVMACDNGNQTTAHTHTAGAAATCVTPQTCTTCGEVMQTAAGHDFEHDDWDEDAIDASCEHPSYDTIACKNAPCTVKDRRTGSHPALGHDLPGAKAATCMADGITGIGHCNRCNENKTGELIPRELDNHDFSGMPVITPATCTTDGEEVVNCGNNGCTKTHGTVLEALKHEGTIQPYAATCTTAGNSDLSGNCVRYAQCSHVVTGAPIPAAGHNWIITPPNFTTETDGEANCSVCSTNQVYKFYKIGDTGPAGGRIFYVAASGITIKGYTGATGSFAEYTAYYLEAAPTSEGSLSWGAYGTLIAGVTTFSSIGQNNTLTIGVGRKDTQTIVNSAAFASLTNTAAQRCANKSLNGFTDWFLPSLGELNEMYKAKGQTGIPTTGSFWSSSQRDIDNAWSQNFSSGSQDYNTRSSGYVGCNIRAIRAF